MNILTKIQHSLSAKLLVLFLGAGTVIMLLVGLMVGKGFSQQFRNSAEPVILHYVTLMQQELGSPPDLDAAWRITRSIPVDIHLFSGSLVWSTSQIGLDPDRLSRFDRGFIGSPHSPYALTRYHNELILHTRDGVYDLYFQIHNVASTSTNYSPIMLMVGLVFGVLVLMFFATRAIFRPMEDIKQGIHEFGAGNFNHRIFKRRNDEFGELASDVNQMAENISGIMEAKRQFLLGISHELRSPLTRCRVNLALMDDSPLCDDVTREIIDMDELIAELLESERLNAPYQVIQPQPVALHTLIEETIAKQFQDAKLKLRLTPVTVDLDPARIKLLVRNLVSNAIKYNGPKTPVRISLTTDRGRLDFAVRDYGQGIPAEYVPLLTEPFYRANATGRRKTGGYGLGLYLCHMIVRAHHGNMTIKSVVGRGTRIRCRFPLPKKRVRDST